MAVIKENTNFITITENGYGKRSSHEDYRLQSRGGKGLKAGNFNEKTGKLVSLKVVNENEDLMLIADNGVIIRMRASDINIIGRNTLGVKIMRLRDGAKIVCVATTEHIEEETAPNTNENAAELTAEEIKFAEDEQPIKEEN